MIPISRPSIGKEEEQAVLDVLRSGHIAQGKKTAELEKTFADFCGTKEAVALNSGTAALHTALKVAGIGAGDEVITTPFTFIATANSILMQNAKPVFADIDPVTFNIDPEKIQEKITPKTKAVIAVDLYGQLADYDKIEAICKGNNLCLIEDAAQSVGAEHDGRKAGSFGDLSTFSFYATKNITSGEGGMLTTDNRTYAEKGRLFRQHGRKDMAGYDYDDLGYNYRMTDIQAALALAQMVKLESFTRKRRENAILLTEGLKDIEGIITPEEEHGKHVYHQYTIRVTKDFPMDRDSLAKALKDKGIGAGVYYPLPLHLCSSFSHLGHRRGDFPESERASKEVLSIPVHPGLTGDDIVLIIQAIKEASHA